MSFELVLRILGALALGAVGWQFGGIIVTDLAPGGQQLQAQVAFAALGFGMGLMLTPFVTTRPYRRLRELAHKAPTADLVAAIIGVFLGLIFAALLATPLSMVPWYFGRFLPIVAAVALAYLGVTIMVARKNDLLTLVRHLGAGGRLQAGTESGQVLVDTSAIIDGRIADIAQAGFIGGVLVVPRFVLKELQHIADSADPLRRNRGRRGLDVLNKLKKESGVVFRVLDVDADPATDVDGKLVQVAKQWECPIVTTDFNLNRVAALQGVKVLNINELANAVKSVVLPGEELVVRVIQEGKEVGQGVAYLDDGTMIVVEGGRRHLNNEMPVVVSRVLQTAAGRMIFAHPRGD